jgi:type I restriction enzyme S subunit
MGEIPSHWQAVRIKWLLNERIERSEDGEGTPLSMSQKYGLIPTSEMDTVPNLAANYIGAKRVYTNDLVFNKLKAHLGVFAISNNDGLVSPDYAVYTPTPRTFLPYLEYLFHTQLYISEFKKKTTGVAIGFTRLYTDGLFAIYSIYPPLEEQKSIVAYLNKKTAEIDEQVSKVEREIELLKEYKQAEVARVVIHGLNPNAPTKPSGISWIGDIPAHWEIRKIKYTFSERSEKNHPDEPVLCATQSQGVIPQSMYDNRVVVVNKGFENLKLVLVGDFVISLRSFQGGVEYAYYQGIISAAYTILTPNSAIDSGYAKLLLKSHNFIQLLKTCVTGIREGQNINYDLLKNKYIPIPPIDEQQDIATYIEHKTTEIDRLVVELTYQAEYLKEYKQRLIADVVTGKINVQPD